MIVRKGVSARKHQAILDAAAEEFKEFGFQGANMDRVAHRAEVSKRTVYNHFASKEKLFERITLDVWRQAQAATELAYDANQSIHSQLMTLAEQELRLLQSADYLRLTAVLVAEFARTPSLADQAREWMTQEESGARRWMGAAVAAGRLNTTDADLATAHFFNLIKGQAFWPQVVWHAPIPTDSERALIASDSVAIFLDHFGPDAKSEEN